MACAIAMLLAALVYLNALDNPFVYDDYRMVVANRAIVPPLSADALFWRDLSRPVVTLSYALDRAAWGPGPFGFHLTNLLLHVANVGLLYELVRRLAGRSMSPVRIAAGAAVLFAVHPMLTEAVGYVSARPDLLGATGFLAAFLCFLGTGRHPGWVVAMLACLALSIGAKESGLMFPAVAFACHHWVLDDEPGETQRRVRRALLPLGVLAAVGVAGRLGVLWLLEQDTPVTVQWSLALVNVDVVRRYLVMLVVPGQQSIFHVVDAVTPASVQALTAVVVVGGLVAIGWRLHRGSTALAGFGIAWFLLLLLPAAALVMLDRGDAMAEHRVYLASAGVFMALAVGVVRLDGRLAGTHLARHVLRVAIPVLVAVLAARTVVRNTTWHDPVVLWTEASMLAPDHWLPYVPLGEALHAEGRHDEAVGAYANALRLRPAEPVATRKLGLCLVETGHLDAADAVYAKLASDRPTAWEAPAGRALVALARRDVEAARTWREQLRTMPLETDDARDALAAIDVALARLVAGR